MGINKLRAECKNIGYKVMDFGTDIAQWIEAPNGEKVFVVLKGGLVDYPATLEAVILHQSKYNVQKEER